MSAEKSGGGVDPKNLWGKPIPQARTGSPPAPRKPAKYEYEETVMDDEDQIDVDAELEDAVEPDESDLQEVEGEYVSVDNLYYDGDSVKESVEAPETDETEESLVASADDEEPDYDAETGDDEDTDDYEDEESSEDGSDDVEEDNYADEAVTAEVADDDDVETPTVARKPQQRTSLLRGNAMPEGKKKVTLSDHVRREIDKRKESGASVRGCDIVAALEKRGISVSQAQVSQLLKKAGLTTGRPGRPAAAPVASVEAPSRVAERKPHAGGVAQAKPQGRPLTTKATPKVAANLGTGFQIPMAQLKAAETFVAACDGSFQKAERILTVAAQLSQAFAD